MPVSGRWAGQDAVEVGALIEVRVARVARPPDQVPGDLQHVVGGAGLLVVADQGLRQVVGVAPALALVAAARGVGAVVGHPVPEVGDGGVVVRVVQQFVAPGRAQDLGQVRVGVDARQVVVAQGERPQKRRLVEAMRERQVGGPVVDRVQIVQHVRHAAELVAHHVVELHVGQLVRAALEVVRHVLGDLQGLPVAAVLVHVHQAGHDLVDRVVGRPDRLAGLQAVEEDGAGRPTDICPPSACWHFASSATIASPLALSAASPVLRYIRAHGREIVADKMAAQFAVRRLPAAERLARRGQAGVPAEVEQQPVGVQRVQVAPVRLLLGLLRPVQQRHLRQIERLHGGRNDRLQSRDGREGPAWVRGPRAAWAALASATARPSEKGTGFIIYSSC